MELFEKLRNEGYEVATFAAGSFWIAEDIFRRVRGVVGTAVGYMGGELDYPTYEEVSVGDTGHFEVVQIVYDPKVVPYEKLLELFWELHNPTVPDEKGEKITGQYGSVIFYHNDEQKSLATLSKRDIERSGKFKKDIITEIRPAARFFRAKEYHQQYFEKTASGGEIIK
ncbi:peptide-methionine (S)-S-oxide reductase MsrA [Methanococcoides orientis]|uniref:peptide-methionine (S)-S-oxide reductase MsrA n=1 Tax=Methanococcoides orientis TaxID=2822137 RepID=UPI001E30D872|nr:peptide-methionine (S)-S-oxide reductase MsrA [Methanococcoides orientis]UGV41410.1 peptide-methionine (S)-S-oxide reductase MsrA [Methanococcoides orientis]